MKIIVNLNGREYCIHGGNYVEFQDKTGVTLVKDNDLKLMSIIPKDALVIIGDNIEKTNEDK